MLNMNTIRQFCRQAALIVPALAMLLGTPIAWGQQQIKKTFAVHTPTTLSVIENSAITGGVDDSTKDFVDIAYGSGPNSLFAASGTKLWRYSNIEDDPSEIHDFADDKMRSILAIAVDPVTEQIYVFAESKGKPTFKLFVGVSNMAGSWLFTKKQEDFPKFIDAVAVNDPLLGLGLGVLAADEKAVYFLDADLNFKLTRKADKKRSGLSGPEHITGLAGLPGTKTVLLGTDDRRLLIVDLSAVPAATVAFGGGLSIQSCMSDREQVIGVAAARDQGSLVVITTDLACDEVRLFGDNLASPTVLPTDEPEGPTTTEGEALDLNSCESVQGCDFDAPGVATVNLESFSGSPDAVLRHVTGMTDCRCDGTCLDKGITLVNGALNLVDILPPEEVEQGTVYDPTFIQQWLQGDPDRECELGAFIVDTPPGTETGIVEGLWEVDDLLDQADFDTRCDTGLQRSDNPDIEAILNWDVIGYAPTPSTSASGGVTVCPDCDSNSSAPEIGFETTLATDACSSSGIKGRGFSVFTYGLSIPSGGEVKVLVDVTDQLIIDLGTAIDELAKPILDLTDPDGYVILDERYDTVLGKWNSTKNSIDDSPASVDSAANALLVQLGHLRSENQLVNYTMPQVSTVDCNPNTAEPDTNCDPDNIQGEVEVRIDVLVFLINERLIPSVPFDGFPAPTP
jgi:hypothetical protein